MNDTDIRTAVVVLGDHGDVLYEHNGDVGFYAASLIKVPLAIAVMRCVDNGSLLRSSLYPVSRSCVSPVDQSTFFIDDDSRDAEVTAAVDGMMTIEQMVWRAIIVSSNETTNALLGLVGFDAVNDVLSSVCGARGAVGSDGAVGSKVERQVFDLVARDAGLDNVITARDAATLMHVIRGGVRTGLTPTSVELVRRACIAQTEQTLIRAATPPDASVGSKQGTTSRVLHDMAFVELNGSADRLAAGYSLAVLTQDLGEEPAGDYVRYVATRAYDAIVSGELVGGRLDGGNW
jgi:beta-lactamase class A